MNRSRGKVVEITKEIFQAGGSQLTPSEDAATTTDHCWPWVLKPYRSEVSGF
jgi:hypothetical protein